MKASEHPFAPLPNSFYWVKQVLDTGYGGAWQLCKTDEVSNLWFPGSEEWGYVRDVTDWEGPIKEPNA